MPPGTGGATGSRPTWIRLRKGPTACFPSTSKGRRSGSGWAIPRSPTTFQPWLATCSPRTRDARSPTGERTWIRPGTTPSNTAFRRCPALPVVVPQQSPPYDIDYDPITGHVWVATWSGGIRRSEDDAQTWQRVVLPPDELDSIDPHSPYDFLVSPRIGEERGHLNHMGFSVLVDEEGIAWAGTARGVNRSSDGLAWRRFSTDGTPGSLTGNWVISIEEQPIPGRNPIWMATWNANESDVGRTLRRYRHAGRGGFVRAVPGRREGLRLCLSRNRYRLRGRRERAVRFE